MNSGPCLICQRPNSPLRRPYGYLCNDCWPRRPVTRAEGPPMRRLAEEELAEFPGADWCEECDAYECSYCRDFNSEHEYEVAEHAATCPDKAEDQP